VPPFGKRSGCYTKPYGKSGRGGDVPLGGALLPRAYQASLPRSRRGGVRTTSLVARATRPSTAPSKEEGAGSAPRSQDSCLRDKVERFGPDSDAYKAGSKLAVDR
jgi:hypothetical protein